MKVFVYYNLHKHCWSVKALEGEQKGKVIHHAESVILQNASGKVSQAGRKRVIKEQSKNVHAGIVGNLFAINTKVWSTDGEKPMKEITYNPYKYSTFVHKNNVNVPYVSSNYVYMESKRVFTF